jgi:SRSO17 transposase
VQACLPNRPWDEEDLNRQRVTKRSAETTTGDGVLVVDETGFPKPGTASVGVARQDSGPLGQVGHCQVAVTGGDADPQAAWPVAVRLDLPHAWAQDPARRQQARVPAEVAFPTKPEMALARLEQARAWGVPPRGVVADADDGDQPHVLAGLEARQERSVVAVRTDFPVSLGHTASTPVWRADAWLHSVPRWPWRTLRWRRGTQGWLRQKCVAVRCWRVTSDGHRHHGWRVGERAPQGQPEERQSDWRHLPAEATREALAGLAHRRQALEPCHEEATGELGWDQSQGRRWLGFQRQAVTVMLASSVLVWLARQDRHPHPRQGRRRDPVPPAAAIPAQHPAGRAS